jgi:hypothetical protein
MKKTLLILFAVLFITAGVTWFYVFHKPKTDYKKTAPDYTVNAEQLYKTYIARNGNKYNGKVLSISGIANNAEYTDSIITVIFVFNEGMFGDEGIRCSFLPEYNNRLKNITFPAQINIKGFCAGYNETDIIMEYCSLQ